MPKDVWITCPECDMPINISEALQQSLQDEEEKILANSMTQVLPCEFCGNKGLVVAIGNREEIGLTRYEPSPKNPKQTEKVTN